MKLQSGSVALSVNWKLTLVGVLMLTLLVRLGFWQLDRAQEKRSLLNNIEKQQSMSAIPLGSIPQAENLRAYQNVTVTGNFMPEKYWLLDNQVLHGKVGYGVIVPFRFNNDQIILIDRGWIAAPLLREQLPAIDMPSGLVVLQGRLIKPSDNRMTRELEINNRWPKRVQKLELASLQEEIGYPILPWLLQLHMDSPEALAVEWRKANITPSKHKAYAVQWFSMAVVLVIALVIANTNILDVYLQDKNSTEEK